jgi:hypothetical protein
MIMEGLLLAEASEPCVDLITGLSFEKQAVVILYFGFNYWTHSHSLIARAAY